MAIDVTVKKQALEHLKTGATAKETASKYGVSLGTIRNWTSKRKHTTKARQSSPSDKTSQGKGGVYLNPMQVSAIRDMLGSLVLSGMGVRL